MRYCGTGSIGPFDLRQLPSQRAPSCNFFNPLTVRTPWRCASASTTSSSCAVANASPSASWRACGGMPNSSSQWSSELSLRLRRRGKAPARARRGRASRPAAAVRAGAEWPHRKARETPTGTPSPMKACKLATTSSSGRPASCASPPMPWMRMFSAPLGAPGARSALKVSPICTRPPRTATAPDREQPVARHVEAAGLAVDHHPARRVERRAAETSSQAEVEAQPLLQQRRLAERLLQHAPVDRAQLSRRARGSPCALQPQGLDVMERVDRASARPPRTQPRARCWSRGEPAASASTRAASTKGRAPDELEIELVGREVREQAERRARLQRALRQRAAEGAVRPGLREHRSRAARPRGARRRRADGSRRRWLAFSSACGSVLRIQSSNTRAPFLRRQAPARVARHDVALAQRKAAGVEVAVHLVGERERSALLLAAVQDQRVVLVGDAASAPCGPRCRARASTSAAAARARAAASSITRRVRRR